jgi:hypothetical protein
MGGEVGLGVCVAGKSIDAMMGDHDALVCILPDPQAQANAHLIAAAPDLYAKLEIAATIFREYERLHLAKGTLDGDAKAYRNAQYAEEMEAALAKARGESGQ